MKISTKGKYGLRAMLDLALHANDNHISLKSIAERQSISEPYLEQLIAVLRKAKLVQSIRGSQGGYRLAKAAKDITIGEILRSLEGSLAPVECVIEGEEMNCEKSGYCVTRVIWERIRDSINAVVDSMTLEDLATDYENKSKKFDLDLKGDFCNG